MGRAGHHVREGAVLAIVLPSPEDIHGSELDGTRSSTAGLLRWILEQDNIPADTSVVMIGDRNHDAVAAKANNLISLGVGYGYGSLDELKSIKNY